MSKAKKTKPEAEEVTADVSLLARLLDETDDENIFLFDGKGDEIELEQIAVISHEKNLYTILRPLTAAEDEAVVFRVDPTDEESITVVDDEVLAEKILEIYHKDCEEKA